MLISAVKNDAVLKYMPGYLGQILNELDLVNY